MFQFWLSRKVVKAEAAEGCSQAQLVVLRMVRGCCSDCVDSQPEVLRPASIGSCDLQLDRIMRKLRMPAPYTCPFSV